MQGELLEAVLPEYRRVERYKHGKWMNLMDGMIFNYDVWMKSFNEGGKAGFFQRKEL